jgi:D-lactate dehydrogenase (cytochrome)
MNAPTAALHLQPRAIPQAFLDALAARFGSRCSTAQAVREQHGRDEGSIQAPPPAAVVFAESTQDVADAVQLADQYEVPVIAYGAGSSLEGHLLAVQGGISIDVSRMNQVLRVNAEDLTVTVQPGITRKQLNDAIKDHRPVLPHRPRCRRLHWRHDVDPRQRHQCRALRHHARERAGPGSGDRQRRIIRTGNRAKKSAAGYDLTRLMVGSEGTLGIFTEITLRLYPLPEAVSAAICSFPSIADAVHTVIQTIQMGVPIARVELVDAPPCAWSTSTASSRCARNRCC